MKPTAVVSALFLTAPLLAAPSSSTAPIAPPQGGQATAGKSIGRISTLDNLIVFELDENALGASNMFDLQKRTLKFTPAVGGGYRAESVALQWDSEFGAEMSGAQVSLKGFAFPFSGRSWSDFSVGVTGSIAFAAAATPGAGTGGGVPAGGRGGGVSIGRFDQLQDAARTLVNEQPAICVFMKPRMSGTRYVKQLDDRVVITWSITEPTAGIQDFTWTPTTNRFQATLYKDGAIQLSYDHLTARDAIVGIYPLADAALEKKLATIKDAREPAVPAQLDIVNLHLAAVDSRYLKATFELRGPALPEGDPGVNGLTYTLAFKRGKVPAASMNIASADLEWTVFGGAAGGRGGGRGGGGRGAGGSAPATRYVASGPGLSPVVTVKGNMISIQGTLPAGVQTGDQFTVLAHTSGLEKTVVDSTTAQPVTLGSLASPEQDLSSLQAKSGPFTTVFESFHYLKLPVARDLTCTVIKALGDNYDFLAYYSDFRVDNQEAGTPSTGPLGGGPDGGAVTGIGAQQRALASYCSAGRFQWQFIQPVYVGSNQMQEQPPAGVVDASTRNIISYTQQIGERTPDRKLVPWNYAMSQIGHEMGHRWSAFVSAKIGNETIPLGPTHWARGLHALVPFPFQRPSEASAMGGGVWQDNFDGTFTQLDDDYYVPATGWSYLDLYLMGLIAPSEVPDFFILRNLASAGRDANGHPIFKADRTKVTVQDVIAVEGPRLPDVNKAQKKFNTGIVIMVEHGKQPSRELIDRANGIREAWMEYFRVTTGYRASMTTNVK